MNKTVTDLNLSDFLHGDLLLQSGPIYSLDEAADKLGIDRHALIAEVGISNALSIIKEREILIPGIQFTEMADRHVVTPGIPQILRHFEFASVGYVSALRFITEPHESLDGDTPINFLKQGGKRAIPKVVQAARDFVGLG